MLGGSRFSVFGQQINFLSNVMQLFFYISDLIVYPNRMYCDGYLCLCLINLCFDDGNITHNTAWNVRKLAFISILRLDSSFMPVSSLSTRVFPFPGISRSSWMSTFFLSSLLMEEVLEADMLRFLTRFTCLLGLGAGGGAVPSPFSWESPIVSKASCVEISM